MPMPLNPKQITREFLKNSLVKNSQRQGEGQAGLLPVLFGEEEAREADKARLALGPSARKERGEASAPPA